MDTVAERSESEIRRETIGVIVVLFLFLGFLVSPIIIGPIFAIFGLQLTAVKIYILSWVSLMFLGMLVGIIKWTAWEVREGTYFQ